MLTMILVLVSLLGCGRPRVDTKTPLEITWGVDDNYVGGPDYFLSTLSLHNTGRNELGDHGWALYFNTIRPVVADSIQGLLAIRRVNGDFYELKPRPGFRLGADASYDVRIVARNWAIRESEAPSGFYFVADDSPPVPVPPPVIKPFVTERQKNRFDGDILPVASPEVAFIENQALTRLPPVQGDLIIPRPVHAKREDGRFLLRGPVNVVYEELLRNEAANLATNLHDLFRLSVDLTSEVDDATPVLLSLDRSGFDAEACPHGEAYRLTVDKDGIRVVGSDPAGVFYGIQSLIAAIDPVSIGTDADSVAVPFLSVDDCPRFGYRGLMIDPARHFQPVDRLKKTIQFMAFYKLNRLQLHLTDDEGWRLPIGALPELNEVGSRRGHTLDSKELLPPSHGSGPDPYHSPGSGHYKRTEFVELLAFARRHHITVIPEIDTPGHMRSAIKSMENRYARLAAEGRVEEARRFLLTEPEDQSTYRSIQGWDDNVANVCLESTYRFMETIFDELVTLYSEAGIGLKVINLGGDEVPEGVWTDSPACRRLLGANENLSDVHDLFSYYFERLVSLLEERGIKGAGWEEIGLTRGSSGEEVAKVELVGRVTPYAWNSVWGWGGEARAYKLANAGYDVVMANAPNLYFDFAYTKHPKEPGFAWGGFVKTRTVFEMTPLDIYNSAYYDRLGNPIDPAAYSEYERLNPEARDRILGIQGQLWGENTMSASRYDYLLYPKLLGLAERAWAPRPVWAAITDTEQRQAEVDADWNLFANAVGQREFVRLSEMYGGVGLRVPPPGGRIVDGKLEANVAFPGLVIRYTTDGSDPAFDSPPYEGAIAVTGEVILRSFTSDGLRSSRPVSVSDGR